MGELLEKAKRVRDAWEVLRTCNAREKNAALMEIAKALDASRKEILEANQRDVEAARERGVRASLVDRLLLNDKRIDDMIESCETVAKLKDPVGEVIDAWVREDGLRIGRVRVPIGPIGVVYESRPNVTVETTVLAIKSGNTILLRGGSDALHSNKAIVSAMKEALKRSKIPESSVEFIENPDRALVGEMIKLDGYLSLIVPRGSYRLINYVRQNATVPVLETGVGNCHIYVDESADLEKAIPVILNAKVQRPGTCNAAEKLLVHEKIAGEFLPKVVKALQEHGVEVRGCERTQEVVEVKPATEEDWETEYLDLIIAVKVVRDVDEAIDHVKRYSTGHSEAILTENYSNARKFVDAIDAAAVYVNASTRFTDGGQFGFGAEIGISTQKLHARGPVGLRELTTYKYVVLGDYHVRE